MNPQPGSKPTLVPQEEAELGYEETKELPDTHNDKAAFMAKIMTMNHPALSAILNNAFHVDRQDTVARFYFDKNHANLIPMLRTAMNRQKIADVLREFYGPDVQMKIMVTDDPGFTKAAEADIMLKRKVKAHPIVKHILENYNGTIIKCEVIQKQKKKEKTS